MIETIDPILVARERTRAENRAGILAICSDDPEWQAELARIFALPDPAFRVCEFSHAFAGPRLRCPRKFVEYESRKCRCRRFEQVDNSQDMLFTVDTCIYPEGLTEEPERQGILF